MSWLQDINNQAVEADAIAPDPRFFEDETEINLNSLPGPKLVLKLQKLARNRSELRRFFWETSSSEFERCDLVAIVDSQPKPKIILIEAKSGDDIDADSEKAYAQLLSSLSILETTLDQCTLILPFSLLEQCDMWAVCVMEALRGHRSSEPRQIDLMTQFSESTDVPLLYLTADRDLWRQIREQSI